MVLPFRTGFGFDVHRLVEGRDLWIGGVKIEHSLGLLGHSDADVAIHALCDAMLGAAALRDIGFHFPDSDPPTNGIEASKKHASDAWPTLLSGKKAETNPLENADITICAEAPKMNPTSPPCRRLWLNALAAIQMTSR